MSKYIAIEANIGRFSWGHKGDVGRFSPNGKLHRHGEADLVHNGRNWKASKPLYAARLIVGFNVGSKPLWKMDDVVRIVRRVRKKQVGDPAATFVLQRGIYSHTALVDGKKLIVDEQGAQIFIVNIPDFETKVRDFQAQMEELAEVLATDLRQEAVILEIQRGGMTVTTISMGPE